MGTFFCALKNLRNRPNNFTYKELKCLSAVTMYQWKCIYVRPGWLPQRGLSRLGNKLSAVRSIRCAQGFRFLFTDSKQRSWNRNCKELKPRVYHQNLKTLLFYYTMMTLHSQESMVVMQLVVFIWPTSAAIECPKCVSIMGSAGVKWLCCGLGFPAVWRSLLMWE